jgi:hypothetical protein
MTYIGPPPQLTTTQRDAIPLGQRPPGLTIWNTTTGQLEVNKGSDVTPVWSSPGPKYLTKTSAVTVTSTVTETALLSGSLNLSAGDLGTNKRAQLSLWGDILNNSGSIVSLPRLRFKLGGTTLIDTNTSALVFASGATRYGWQASIEVLELGVTNAQATRFRVEFGCLQAQAVDPGNVTFTTGEGSWGPAGAAPTGTPKHGLIFASGINTASALDATTALAVELTVVNGSASGSVETKLIAATLSVN